MQLKAYIVKKDRRLFPYEVEYRHGFGIPERSASCHMTLKAAERAAKRYTKTHEPDQIIRSFSGDDGKREPSPPPPRTLMPPRI